MLDPSRHQILIVDDDEAVRHSLSLLLEASGYEVSSASNGVEALELLKSGLSAVVLSDLQMPKMSGYELLSVVRHNFPKLPIVAMSGAAVEDTTFDGVVADAYYFKGQGNLRCLLQILSEMTGAASQAAGAPQFKERLPIAGD
jgi:CheY-like chemotaxis protein